MNIARECEKFGERLSQLVHSRSVAELAIGGLALLNIQMGLAAIDQYDDGPVGLLAGPVPAMATVAAETTTTTEVPTTTLPPPTPTTEAPTTTTTLPPPTEPVFTATAVASPERGKVGADQSWPNCLTPLRPDISFGIVGVNDGQPFETNRCLPELLAKFKALGITPGLYVNTNLDWAAAQASNDEALPCPATLDRSLCPAYRWGYRGGQYAVQAAWEVGSSSREWYLDVETANRWAKLAQAENYYEHNRASLLGTMDAIRTDASRHENIPPGDIYQAVYSFENAWRSITANWRLPGIHTWYATAVPEAEVLRFCDDPRYNLTGGGVIMVQTVDHANPGGAIDINVRC